MNTINKETQVHDDIEWHNKHKIPVHIWAACDGKLYRSFSACEESEYGARDYDANDSQEDDSQSVACPKRHACTHGRREKVQDDGNQASKL